MSVLAERAGAPGFRAQSATPRRQLWDIPLLLVVVFLLGGGLLVVLDASSPRSLQSSNDPFALFIRQARFVGVAAVALLLTMNVPYWRWKRYTVAAFVISLFMLLVVLVAGREINGSKRWLFIGSIGFQPSEIAKITLVLALAHFYGWAKGHLTRLWRGFMPPVALILAAGGLIAIEDLGTAIVVVATGLSMLFVMGARKKHLAALCAVMVLGAVTFVQLEDYRRARISAWIALLGNPMLTKEQFAPHLDERESRVLEKAIYQPSQGLIALGSGGLTGRGLMQGAAKHLYLPAEHTDYIFATLGEEVGLAGSLIILGGFAFLIIRGLTIAHRTVDPFGNLLAFGLTCALGIQAILNVGVVTCLLPCTGVPLPFISYGGTSLVFTTAAAGVILNISRYPHRREPESERRARASRSRGRRDGGARLPGP